MWGIADRGVLRRGALRRRQRHRPRPPRSATARSAPRPADRRRPFAQAAIGYVATIVNGQILMREGNNGSVSGRVLRNALAMTAERDRYLVAGRSFFVPNQSRCPTSSSQRPGISDRPSLSDESLQSMRRLLPCARAGAVARGGAGDAAADARARHSVGSHVRSRALASADPRRSDAAQSVLRQPPAGDGASLLVRSARRRRPLPARTRRGRSSAAATPGTTSRCATCRWPMRAAATRTTRSPSSSSAATMRESARKMTSAIGKNGLPAPPVPC